ncbi:hypothetical protein [Halobellus rubicundus]|uniref:Uncharacterized protein n=1 Tax=Halobellus rubicundus TaxID=2996466 RepID=A0ABD5MJ71_9EURY
MSEFSTTAALETVVDERSLSAAEQTITDRLGDVTVRVDARPQASADGGQQTTQQLGRAPQQGPSVTGGTTASEPEGVSNILTAQLEVQEGIYELVEDIADQQDGGLLGGTDIFQTLTETGAGAAGEVAGESAGAVADVVGSAAGPALGSVIGESLRSLFPGGDGGSVELTKPGWVPLEVTRPSWTPLAVDRPEWIPLSVDEPAWSVTVSEPSWKVEVARPDWKIPVAKTGQSISIQRPDWLGSLTGGQPDQSSGGQTVIRQTRSTGRQTGTADVPGKGLAESVIEGAGKGGAAGAGLGVALGFAGGPFAPLSVPTGGVVGGAAGGIIGGTAGAIGYFDRRFEATGGGRSSARPVTNEISIENRPRYEIRVDGPDRNEIRRAVEDAQRDNLRELESRLDDVEQRLDRMKRAFESGTL